MKLEIFLVSWEKPSAFCMNQKKQLNKPGKNLSAIFKASSSHSGDSVNQLETMPSKVEARHTEGWIMLDLTIQYDSLIQSQSVMDWVMDWRTHSGIDISVLPFPCPFRDHDNHWTISARKKYVWAYIQFLTLILLISSGYIIATLMCDGHPHWLQYLYVINHNYTYSYT